MSDRHLVFLGYQGASLSTKMAASRASNWSDREIKQLISVWSEDSVQNILQGKRRNTGAYEEIARKVEEFGYSRTKDQIQVRCVLKNNKVSSRTRTKGTIQFSEIYVLYFYSILVAETLLIMDSPLTF